MAQSNWEADKMLDVYIYDYLLKRNLHDSAKAFMAEGKVSGDPVGPWIDALASSSLGELFLSHIGEVKPRKENPPKYCRLLRAPTLSPYIPPFSLAPPHPQPPTPILIFSHSVSLPLSPSPPRSAAALRLRRKVSSTSIGSSTSITATEKAKNPDQPLTRPDLFLATHKRKGGSASSPHVMQYGSTCKYHHPKERHVTLAAGTLSSQGLPLRLLNPAEVTGIMNDFAEPGSLAPTGLFLGSTKYMVLQGEPGAVIRGKKGAGGVTIKKTGQALVIGNYEEPVTPGQCNMVVERLGDYLVDKGL